MFPLGKALRLVAGNTVRFAVFACIPLASIAVACTDAVVIAEGPAEDAGAPPSSNGFTPPPAVDGGDAASSLPEAPKLCIATECPAPYATCGAGHRCGTNLSNDPANCGACGNACQNIPMAGLRARCAGGSCQYECIRAELRDCNGLVDDGCEVDITGDPANCGTCGNECAPGQRCIKGQCGCPPPLTDCNGVCVDLQNDPANCTACGLACPSYTTLGLPAPPTNMAYTCAGGQCGKLTCSGTFRDCDGDPTNGCETNIANDTKNCARCHAECDPGEICAITGSSSVPRCICKGGATLCVSGGSYQCADLLSDVKNCGACGYTCPTNNAPNVVASCEQGLCASQCVPGFADCDGNPSNGCEVNLMIDASNCGTCGHWCNAGAGQPCVEGACLMKDCEGGPVN